MATKAPRRLDPAARRSQLVGAAMKICARDGWDALTLDAVADAAGVTRGLMYRYFPAGRDDLLVAITDEAAERLSVGFDTDPATELREKTAANLALVLEHAGRNSDPWIVMRAAQASSLPEVTRRVEDLLDSLVSAISLNNLGTEAPPEPARVAIRGYIAFASSVLDDMARGRITQAEVGTLLGEVFEALMAPLRA
jgi:AcrR family transcriptional regulator